MGLGVLDVMAKMGAWLPTVMKPKQTQSLGKRLMWTGIVLVVYLIMAHTPLYGVQPGAASTSILARLYIMQIIFASNVGTLMELGIGPIVTAGLIMQILVGAKLLKLDLSNIEDRKKFTEAQKVLALLVGLLEASLLTLSWHWNPAMRLVVPWYVKLVVILQLLASVYIVMLLDEMIQKGWGLGSGVSLFILAGVTSRVFWWIFSPLPLAAMSKELGLTFTGINLSAPLGFVPYVVWSIMNGYSFDQVVLRYARYTTPQSTVPQYMQLPDLVGFTATIGLIILLIYLEGMKVEIPVTSQRMRGIRTRVPLKFLYVTNIPILLVGILYSDLQLFLYITASVGGSGIAQALDFVLRYMRSPLGPLELVVNPMRVLIYSVIWGGLAILFGLLWVEIAGLSPAQQAENLIKSGLEIPGIRRNPRILERMLAKYIYPLTILSSLIVASIAIIANILGAYGSGTGLLLAVGIIYQYYMMIAYERTLEAYPMLKKLLGEE